MTTPVEPVNIEHPSGDGSKKIWRVGTLVYTLPALIILFFWLLWGDFAWALKDRSTGPAMQLMLDKFHAPAWYVGLMMGALPPAIGLVFNPIISHYSDRHRSRWGRRIPFLLIPAPITALSMCGLAFTPMIGQWLHELLGAHSFGVNACTLIIFAFFWTLFDFAGTTVYALYGALVNDVVPEVVLGRFFAAWRILSLGAGVLFNYWLMGKVETHYFEIFIGIGLIYGIGFSMMCLKVKEGDYPPPPPLPEESGPARAAEAVREYFQNCFGSSYYFLAFIVMAVPAIAFVPVNLFGILFAKNIGMNIDMLGKWTAGMYAISVVLSYPLGVLADRFHPLRIGMVTLALYGVVTMLGGFFIRDATTFTIAYVATGVLAGAWMTSTASLPQRLLPKAKFAEYNSAVGIINCLAQILIAPVLGVFLDMTGHVYRYSYLVSFAFAMLCLGVAWIVYRRFMKLGGPQNYVAP